MTDELKNYRIDKPMDYLHKRLFLYNGPLMHEFFKFPGKYVGPCPNSNLNGDGSISEVDISYLVIDGENQKLIINVEDETSNVNEETLKKSNKYKINHQYAYKYPVYSVITTSLPSNRCLKELKTSPTDIFRPKIISYLDFNGEKILNRLKTKIKNNNFLTKLQLLSLILVIRTFPKNNSEILEEICSLIKIAKSKDKEFKMEMVYCSRYIIHKYAKTVEDILRLEEVVGLNKAVTCGSIIENIKKEGEAIGEARGKAIGEARGKAIGETRGSLSILNALVTDPDFDLSIDLLVEKFGFTSEQILNGK